MSSENRRTALLLACGAVAGYTSPSRVSPKRTGLWRPGSALGRPQTLF
ncbi:hypothetical protein [Aeromicrobium chenweiae]|nr:hypothetical protein [Aeromicrobium chenweiae]